jgi:hypothetical protein
VGPSYTKNLAGTGTRLLGVFFVASASSPKEEGVVAAPFEVLDPCDEELVLDEVEPFESSGDTGRLRTGAMKVTKS